MVMSWGSNGSARTCDTLLVRVENNDPTLKDLIILPLKKFGSQELIRLSKALERNTCLRSLHASGHAINDLAALETFGRALKSTTCPLMDVAIGDCSLGDEGVVAFCRGLQTTTNDIRLRSLDLSWKGIGNQGLASIVEVLGTQLSLKALNLSRNESIEPSFDFSSFFSSASSSTRLFPNVCKLDLSACRLNAKSCASLFKAMTGDDAMFDKYGNEATEPSNKCLILNLNASNLKDLQHSPQMLVSIANNKVRLSELYLSECKLGNEGLQLMIDAICKRDDLVAHTPYSFGIQVLDLSDNQVTTVGMNIFFSRLTEESTSHPFFARLRKLSLAKNKLDTECCKLLAKLINRGPLLALEELDVTDISCPVEGAIHLIRSNFADDSESKLTSLTMFGNRLGFDGFVRLSKELEGGHPKLCTLDLGGNEATEAGVAALLQSFIRPEADGKQNALRLLVVGGNQGGSTVEALVKHIRKLHPNLDIAREIQNNQ